MTSPIVPINGLMNADAIEPLSAGVRPAQGGFANLILQGLAKVDQKEAAADKLVSAFAVDDTIPVHRVMYALEEADGAVQMMLQVRGKLVDAYQELMRMQL